VREDLQMDGKTSPATPHELHQGSIGAGSLPIQYRFFTAAVHNERHGDVRGNSCQAKLGRPPHSQGSWRGPVDYSE